MFSNFENKINSIFLDFPDSCDYAIIDLLESNGLYTAPHFQSNFENIILEISHMVEYINNELSLPANNEIILPRLIRKQKYPKLRQMRDVHQFDVGTHLAYCNSLAIRYVPIKYVEKLGFHNCVSKFLELRNNGILNEHFLAEVALYHDFFKCFRNRRKLPSKIGETQSIHFRLPNGNTIENLELNNEEKIAAEILPYFKSDTGSLNTLLETIGKAGEMGSFFYKLLLLDENMYKSQLDAYFTLQKLDTNFFLAFYQALVDYLGKGHARKIITTRKNALRSLMDVIDAFLQILDTKIHESN